MTSARALRRRAAIVGAAAVLIPVSPPASAQSASPRLLVIGVPAAAWPRAAADNRGGLGLGVYPDSRSGGVFVEEIGAGSPRGGSGAPGGAPGALGRSLSAAGIDVGVASTGPPEVAYPLGRAFSPDPSYVVQTDLAGALASDVAVVAVATSREASDLIARTDGAVLLLGVGRTTPVWIGLCASRPCTSAILDGGIARRPAITTPYDLAATVLDLLDVPKPESIAGASLRVELDARSLANVRALAGRLERDAVSTPALAASAVAACIGLLALAMALHAMRRLDLARRLAQAAALTPAGWIAAHFVSSSHSETRFLVVAATALLGALLPLREPARVMSRIGLGAAVAFALLVAIAPMRPGGEPGLSIWGNPLVSWRFFGLQNVPAAFLACGIVVWGALSGLAPAALAAVAAAAAVVLGAPAVGANFVGVLTFVIGATLAVLVVARKRLDAWHVVVAAVLGAGAFALALVADAGSPVSHGGRAARRISEGGVGTAIDLVEARLRLNIDLIRDFFAGIPIVALLAVLIVALITWGVRVERGPLRARAAVLAGAVMALSSLVLEDSGFYSGTVIFFIAAVAWQLGGRSASDRDLIDTEGLAP